MALHELEVVEFYVSLTILEGNVATSRVKGVEIGLGKVKLGKY